MNECKNKGCTRITDKAYCSDKCLKLDFWDGTKSFEKEYKKKATINKKKKSKVVELDITINHLEVFDKQFPDISESFTVEEKEEYLKTHEDILKKVNSYLFLGKLFKHMNK